MAQKLGITYDDYLELQTQIDDSVGTVNYLAVLQSSPKHIVDKIKGLDSLNRFKLDNIPDDDSE